MTIDEMIAVLQAAKQGETLQVMRNRDGSWVDLGEAPNWNFSVNTYRVKPEPREWRVPVGILNSWHEYSDSGLTSQVKVREVLE